MADAPWRCSQCGTVNEPVANACRTCGRWPSLFELEGSTIEAEQAEARAPVEVYEPDVVEPEYIEPEYEEPEVYEVGAAIEVDVEVDSDEEPERPKPLWQRLASLIIPIAIVLYIIVSALVNNGG
jgi:predicted  nucleic acid-binding Zn-ribbon protein